MSLWGSQAAAAANHARRSHALHWLSTLGLPGLFGVAVIDSSPIPLPIPGITDLLLLWLASHKTNPWLAAACAIAGGVLGGYSGWRLGLKGGDSTLRKRVPRCLLAPVHRWARSNPFLAVFLPALLPPPVPLSPFVLAAGALGVPRNKFLAAFGCARTIRYSLVAWLGATYGRHVIRLWSAVLDKWSTPILIVFATLFFGGIVFAIVSARRDATRSRAGEPASEPAAD